MDNNSSFEEFCGIIEQLRSDDGCPWDREQTHTSLKQCLIEEAYEVLEGIDEYDKTKNYDNLKEELGDVLLQVVMHSVIAKEEGIFTIQDVIQEIAAKMIRRHPHVFGEIHVDSSNQVLENWEEIKKAEKKEKNSLDGLEGIPKAFPALLRAQKVIKKAGKLYGKQELWSESDLIGCISNLKQDSKQEDQNKRLGGLLFELCKLAQEKNIDAEQCLFDYIQCYIDGK